MPPFVPPEIVDEILGHLELSGGTLCSCARVCRSWLPIARCHLFSSLRIESVEAYDSFVLHVLHSSVFRPYLSTVRSLLLLYHQPRSLPAGKVQVTYEPHGRRAQAYRLFLLEFSGRLPALNHLSLINLDWMSVNPSYCREPLLLSTFPSLTSLMLLDCYLPSFSFLRRALTAIPSLAVLCIRDVHWDATNAVTNTDAPRTGPKLVDFQYHYSFYTPWCDQLLRWLSQTPTRASLRNLRFHPGGYYHQFLMYYPHQLSVDERRFLSIVAPHVEYAELIPVVSITQCVWSNVDELLVDATRQASQWAELFDLLRATPRLRLLQIKINSLQVIPRAVEHMCIKDDEVKELDLILGQEGRKALERVEFLVTDSDRDAEDVLFAGLVRRLPKLHQAKILALKVVVRSISS